MILILYQYLSGRILFRSLFVILLPAFMINLFLIIECCQKKSDCKILFVLIAFLCLPFTSSLFLETTFDDTSNNSKKATTAKSTQIEKYAIVNSDKVFIIPSGLYNNINPDALYPDEKPSNIISYGGSSYNAKSYRTALHNNGIDTLSGETFKRIDVYFICFGGYSPNSTLELFYQFLENGYGAIGFVQEDEILNSVYSYRFVFEENANDFDRYYSVVDGNIIEVQNEKSVEDAD